MGHLLRTISLLTVIPVRASWDGEPELGKAAAFFPLVGALVGAPAAALGLLLGSLTRQGEATALLSAALVLLVLEGLTGFLHLDGWADCCDAFLPALSRERRLEIMRDPRLGCFGVTGLVLLLFIKLAAVAALLSTGRNLTRVLPVAVAPVLARSVMVLGAGIFPLARSEGMATALRRGLGGFQVVVALALGLGSAALLGWHGAVCAAVALLAARGLGRLAGARIGGSTGDVYGATSELAETSVLVACAFLGRLTVFRIGTTSYIIPADILTNVEYLAPRVDDVELVLFETDEHGSNLPDAALRERLRAIAEEHGLTYTVHLPLDVLPGAVAGEECLVKAAHVIDATRGIDPFAYVMHLDGRLFVAGAGGGAADLEAWRDEAARALETICGWIGAPRLLAVENVEAWDPGYFAPMLGQIPVSRTADIGHLWLRGEEPLAVLPAWLERTRVVHLHEIAERDHVSLAHVTPERLDPVVALLADRFDGVLTLEVFNEEDLHSSLEALRASLERVGKEGSSGR